MGINLNMNAVNQVDKGSLIYEQKEKLTSICLILKGRVFVKANGVRTVFGSGNFLGVCDIEKEVHSFQYQAYDDVTVFCFPVAEPEDLWRLLEKKPEYRGLLNTSLNFFIQEMKKISGLVAKEADSLYGFMNEAYKWYQAKSIENGIHAETLASISGQNGIKQEETDTPILKYYLSCAKMPVEAQKNYYQGNEYVCRHHFSEQVRCVEDLLGQSELYVEGMFTSFRALILDERNLFQMMAKLTLDVAHLGKEYQDLLKQVDEIVERINAAEEFLIKKAGKDIQIDRKWLEETYFALLSSDSYEEKMEVADQKKIGDLDHSMEQILEYAPVSKEVKAGFSKAVDSFLSMENPFSRTKEALQVRKGMSDQFYKIYEAVFLKTMEDSNVPLVIQLFLKYGYVTEKLFQPEFLEKLMQLEERKSIEGADVFLLPDWLRTIYNRENDPSKNEFDMDFKQFLNAKKRDGSLEPTEARYMENSPKERVHFEVMNLYRYANRLVNGKISTFIPILHQEEFIVKIENAYLTADRLNSIINKVEALDYSIFYREKLMSYENVGVTKVNIYKKYIPNIILFPMYGEHAIMWQDISGKYRQSKGRILFPTFLEVSAEVEIMKVLGQFRWEICRTEQGMHWDDFHYPSLTSAYSDYLQFYKKNGELSTDTKTKIKAQLQSCNNHYRDVFSKDYIEWLTRESKGNIRLNRVARGILSTYCPFVKSVRQRVCEQKQFDESYRQFTTKHHKVLKDLDIIERKFAKEGKKLPIELSDTIDYFKNT